MKRKENLSIGIVRRVIDSAGIHMHKQNHKQQFQPNTNGFVFA